MPKRHSLLLRILLERFTGAISKKHRLWFVIGFAGSKFGVVDRYLRIPRQAVELGLARGRVIFREADTLFAHQQTLQQSKTNQKIPPHDGYKAFLL